MVRPPVDPARCERELRDEGPLGAVGPGEEGAWLARRLELAEAMGTVRCGKEVLEVAGGYAVFAGPVSPVTQAIGVVTGLSFGVAVVALAFLPETRGKQLLVYD